jgi:DNA-binding HxlR family transcriptional regulator
MPHFNTENPEQLIYSNSMFTIEVLGGVRIEGLDRMRVTLKVSLNESEIPPIRHNLDLYNDTQLEKFIRKIAERLEIGAALTAGTLAELTQTLENYRLERIKANADNLAVSTPLTEAERQAAEAHLKSPKLLEQTLHDLQVSGIQGEAENALILLLAMTSRKTPDPISVICLARSGTGKSYLMERVALCIPDEDKREHTQFTGNSFYYYKREEIKNKIFLIEDLEGAMGVLFPIRELQSKKRISKTITQKGKDGKLQTTTLIVEGPVCVIACTTKESIYEDNANRSILIYLNDSKEQDEKVMRYQKQHRAGLVNTYQEYQTQLKLQHMQKVLQPIKVINPYAPQIDLPENFPKKRRALPILLNVIEAITFYHQYQRPQQVDKTTGELYIQSAPEDIENGFKYLKNVLFRRSDELSGAVRDFYETLKTVVEKNELQHFKTNQIRQHIGLTPRSIQNYLKELTEYGYLEIVGGKQRVGYEYILQEGVGTTETQLQANVEQHIQYIMQRIQPKAMRNECETPLLRIETTQNKAIKQNEVQNQKHKDTKKTPSTMVQLTPKEPTPEQAIYNTWNMLKNNAHQRQFFTVHDLVKLTGRSHRTESRYLKELCDQNLVHRTLESKNKTKNYHYHLVEEAPQLLEKQA